MSAARASPPGTQTLVPLLLDGGPWASYKTSLCLHLLVSCWEDEHAEQCPGGSECLLRASYCYVCYFIPNVEDKYVSYKWWKNSYWADHSPFLRVKRSSKWDREENDRSLSTKILSQEETVLSLCQILKSPSQHRNTNPNTNYYHFSTHPI